MKKLPEFPQNPESVPLQDELMASVACGVFACSLPDHRVLSINRRAEEIMGVSQDDDPCAFSTFIEEKVLPESREELRGAVESLKAPGDSAAITFKAKSQDGIVHIKAKLEHLCLSDGSHCLLCTMTDITEQTQLIDTLVRDRFNYREALTNGSEYSFSFDLTEGVIRERFTTANNIDLFKILGLSVPVSYDEMSKKYVRFFGIEFIEPSMAQYFTCRGLLDAYENGINNVIAEYFGVKTNIYIRAKYTMYLECETGHVYAFVVATNTTAARRKEKEQAEALKAAFDKLNKANDQMNTTLEAVLDGISGGLRIIDAESYEYISISEGAARLQGYTVSEFTEKFGGNVTGNIYPPDRKTAAAEAIAQSNEQGSYNVKYRIQDRRGNIKWVIDRGKLVTQPDGKRFFYSVMQDVTELENRNARLNDVLAMQEQMADSLGTGIFAYTLPHRKVLILNQAVREMFGYRGASPELFGHAIMGLVAEEDRPNVVKAVKSLKKIGDTTEYVFRSKRADGSDLIVRNSTKLLSFQNGQKFILSAMVDITQQENDARSLDEAHRRFHEAVISDDGVFFTIDLSDGICSKPIMDEGGERILKQFGVDLPMRYDDFINACFGNDRDISAVGDADSISSCEKLMVQYKNGVSRLDAEYHIPESEKYYRMIVLLSELSGGGHIQASVILYDITDGKKAKKYSSSIIESLGRIYLGIYYISLRDRCYFAVKQHEDLSADLPERGSFDDFLVCYYDDYVLPSYIDELKEFFDLSTLAERLKNVNSVNTEYRRKKLGWCRAVLAAAGRDSKGNVNAVVFAVSVIEDEKKEEHARQEALRSACESANLANAAKTNFLANMSHDIRTPMNAIAGMTAIAETHIDDKERVSYCLSKIHMSSNLLLGIINEILDMSKIESGKLELHEEFFNLPELIDNLITMTKPEIIAKKHKIAVTIRNIEHENVVGDSQRIQQVFMNLMSNAVKYTPDGGEISITVTERPTNKQTIGCYEFIFRDNGIGMSEDFISRIFEPFARAEGDSRINNIQGTGLGMPIAKNIVHMMNGDIKVESRLNEGTSVTVTVFLKIENDNFSAYDDRFKGMRVLVADDDESSCISVCEMLAELGMVCEWVADGGAAVEKAVERHSVGDDYFAVILGRKMPGADGITAAKEIRKRIGSEMPKIIFSSFDWSDIEHEAREAGANAFISKPIFRSRILHLFNELIGYGENEKKTNGLDVFKAEDFSSKRALLVEDNELNAEIAGEILSLAGLKVEYAVNGKEAVDRIANDEFYDIVFMDIQMPVMNGYEATRTIRALPGSYPKRVPIIAMTANAFAEDVAAAKNAGMNEHISKPIDFDRLLEILNKWLETE